MATNNVTLQVSNITNTDELPNATSSEETYEGNVTMVPVTHQPENVTNKDMLHNVSISSVSESLKMSLFMKLQQKACLMPLMCERPAKRLQVELM